MVVARADGFDAQGSTRRFTIGGPDAVLAVVLPALFASLAKVGPKIDLATRLTLPQSATEDPETRKVDIVVGPTGKIAPRFASTSLYDEDFAIALRSGHPLGRRMSLAGYCSASHVLVSMTGDPHGNVDMELKKLGRTRRVAATVPNFLLALTLVAETDLVAAVPRQAAAHARRLGVVLRDPPAPLSPLTRSPISVLAMRAALEDAGVAWLFDVAGRCMGRSRSR